MLYDLKKTMNRRNSGREMCLTFGNVLVDSDEFIIYKLCTQRIKE